MKRIIFAPALLLLVASAWAARPLVTDDARLTTAQSCQLETWVRIYADSEEFWALPACNPTGNLEFTLGGGRLKPEGQKATSDYVFQAKTLFRPLQANDWGWGLAVGTVQRPEANARSNLLGHTYAYVPVSASFYNDRIIVHTNFGWLHNQETRKNDITWGAATELNVSSRFLTIVETFGDHRNQPFWQVGGRFAIVPNRVQIDATVGQQFSSSSSGRWFSLGLRFTPDRLF